VELLIPIKSFPPQSVITAASVSVVISQGSAVPFISSIRLVRQNVSHLGAQILM
jgi:hypothetical protein